MQTLVGRLLLLCALLVTFSAFAQSGYPPATISPGNPTAANLITSSFTYPENCSITVTTTLIGTTVHTDVFLASCVVAPPGGSSVTQASFGPLPAGTYTYEIFFRDDVGQALRSSQTLVVGPAPLPAFSAFGEFALLLTLLAAGWIAMNRIA